MESINYTLQDLSDREKSMHEILHKEFVATKKPKDCAHENDGHTYQDEDVVTYITYRCRKCGMFYDVPIN